MLKVRSQGIRVVFQISETPVLIWEPVLFLLLWTRGWRSFFNEFGEVGIDGELLRSCQVCDEGDPASNIVELANGYLCCTVQFE